MDAEVAARIRSHPKFQTLVRRRSRFGWLLTAIMLAAYFGYIGAIAFKKPLLARPIGDGVTSLGIPVGVGLIVLTVLLTGLYVVRANGEFDRLTREILAETGQ